MGIFDNSCNRFLGNIMGFSPAHVKTRGTAWEFYKVSACACVSSTALWGAGCA